MYRNFCASKQEHCQTFDWSEYQSALQTRKLGQVVIHSEVITSTNHVLDGDIANGCLDNVLVVADVQTQGSGRAGNVWHSPKGCTMMSIMVWIFLPRLRQCYYCYHCFPETVFLELKVSDGDKVEIFDEDGCLRCSSHAEDIATHLRASGCWHQG